MKPTVVVSLLISMTALVAACSTPEQTSSDADRPPTTTVRVSSSDSSGEASETLVIPQLPSAVFDPSANDDQPQPVSISIDSLEIDDAPIEDVGIEPNGEMEVPEPQDVGWYSFGPTPGAEGSSVLAAHIASGGVDGVFRYLDQVEPGDIVTIEYGDSQPTQQFRIDRVEQYNKTQLPFEDIFRRSGDPQLVLVTCGGDFNETESSYEDNVVAYATPISTG